MSSYAWTVTLNYIDDSVPLERWGIDSVPADVSGPRGATDEQLANVKAHGVPFAMYDDDGILYYRGKFWADDGSGSDSEYAFAPLDDYGAPNAGAVTIRYRNTETGKWETL